MTHAIRRAHRGVAAGILLLGGAAVAVATWIGGDHGWAIVALGIYAVLAIIAFVWAGRQSDVGAILRASAATSANRPSIVTRPPSPVS